MEGRTLEGPSYLSWSHESHEDTGRSIVDNVLWPLLEMRHFASADLQEVLNHAVTLQLEANWQFGDVAKGLVGIWTEISNSSKSSAHLDDSKKAFVFEVKSYEALANAVRAAYSKFPFFIETMLLTLTWIQMPLNIRCDLCIDLVHLWMQRGRSS